MNLEELKCEVSQLSPSDLERFSKWFKQFKADRLDKQIEEDNLIGWLNPIARQAIESGAIPFPKTPTPEQLAALEAAGQQLDEELSRLGLSEDELLEDFEQWRRQRGNA